MTALQVLQELHTPDKHGYVKAHRGFYHDAIFVKRNNFNLLLHETFGGGFSPTAVLKLRRLARKVARGSVDRTAYSPKYSLSFMSHHAERISLSVVRGVNRAIRSHLATLSAPEGGCRGCSKSVERCRAVEL